MLVIKVEVERNAVEASEIRENLMSRTHVGSTIYSAKKLVRKFLDEYFKEWDSENIPAYRIKI